MTMLRGLLLTLFWGIYFRNFPAGLGELYGISGIKPRLPMYKTSTLPAALSLQPPVSRLFNMYFLFLDP